MVGKLLSEIKMTQCPYQSKTKQNQFDAPSPNSLRTGSQRGRKKKIGERVGASCAFPPHQTALGLSRSPYNHCHIVGTQTPYLSRPPAPTRSMLFTNRKSALARSSDKLCFPTLNGGKGVCVCQRLMTLIVDYETRLSHPKPNREPVRRL